MIDRPLLIAECCQNHQGKRSVLQRMIHEAAENGADYVKIQALRSADLTRRERFEDGVVADDGTRLAIKRPYTAEFDRLRELDLTPDDEAWFAEECLRAGVRSMITVFTRASVAELTSMGFDAVKVASYDCASFPLLRELSERCSQVFVSTGATDDAEVERAARELRGTWFALLHCVTIYPTPFSELHLRRMGWLRRFTPVVGFSDHTAPAEDGLAATKLALALGADVVERHFTVLDPSETRDGPVSINAAMLKELRAFADRPRSERMAVVRQELAGWESALGLAQRELSPTERLNRDYYAGRVASKVEGRDVYNWEDVLLPGAGT